MTSVWVVDDDEDYRQLVTLALREHCGVEEVRVFREGTSALRVAQSASGDALPDLVLMDLHMPRTTGLEAMRQLRLHHPSLPVAILSNAATDEEVRACLAEKPLAFLRKPFGFHELVDALRLVVEGVPRPTAAPSA